MNNKELLKAFQSEELANFFVERANAGDVEGLVALYEPEAVLVIDRDGKTAIGSEAIRSFYAGLLTNKPKLKKGQQDSAIRNGELALTSSRLVNGIVTAEVARKQPDGSRLWIIDQPVIAVEQ